MVLDRPSAPMDATPERPIPPRATVCARCWLLTCREMPWGCSDESCPCSCRENRS